MIRCVCTSVLQIAYIEQGPADGQAVILLHGWPSDVHDWDEAATTLAAQGVRVIRPWLRGFGPTHFLDSATPRSGQQAALGADLRDLMDALGIQSAVLGGYDWGGRAACVVAALWPERVKGLLSITGYNVHNIPASGVPGEPPQEHRYWYQWYFHTERGRAGLEANRRGIARLLWQLWSPNWRFDDATFDATASSFDNADFVAVTVQSYRHRYGNALGDPACEAIEAALAHQPLIRVPTIVLHGACDGVQPASLSEAAHEHFSGAYQRRVIPQAGHFLSREAPHDAVAALRALVG